MKRLIASVVVALIALSIAGHLIWNQIRDSDYQNEIVHETERWAVIQDLKGDRIAIEPSNDEVWIQIVNLNQNRTRMWIGGIVEEYHNKWGFRFKPENVTIAQITAGGLQATIQFISEDLDYWLSLEWAYVSAQVTEVHNYT